MNYFQVGGYRYSHANVRGYPGAGMGPGGQCNVMRHDQQRHHAASTFPAMNLQGNQILLSKPFRLLSRYSLLQSFHYFP